ncbi:MAG TPA: cytochrome c [Candidatus Limnocylindrales bacterium]|nr:cytochrome c [Candidatus Limnocylindrales bacterium]
MRGFVGGIVAALVIVVVVVLAAIQFGLVPARADGPLMPGERWAAKTSLKAAIEREAPKPPYPYSPPSDADVAQGAKLYVQNCAVCHGTANSTPDSIARGLGVRPPQFNKNDVMDDPEGETYWKIEHGIRFTGMPSYAHSLDEKSIWQLTYFMKRAPDHLSAEAKKIWENPSLVPPPTPMPAIPVKPGQGSSGPP